MPQNKRYDEDGPRIHRTEQKDTFHKHRNSIYDLLDDEVDDLDFDDEDDYIDDLDSEEDWLEDYDPETDK